MAIECKDQPYEIVFEHRNGRCRCHIAEVRAKDVHHISLFLMKKINLYQITGIHCGHLPSLPNGQIVMEKTSAGDAVKYSCNDNYYLAGPKIRYCLINGTWSDSQPECISMRIYFRLHLIAFATI